MTNSVAPKLIKTDNGMKVSGALVFANVSSLFDQSKKYFKQHQSDIFVIDCSAMERIDSAGIALLIEWQRQSNLNKSSKTGNTQLLFEGLSDQAQSLIDAYHLQAIIAA